MADPEMTVVIPAARHSSRIQRGRSRLLLGVGGETVLTRLVRQIHTEIGPRTAILVLCAPGDGIRHGGVQTVCVPRPDTLSLVETLSRHAQALTDPCLIVPGDLVLAEGVLAPFARPGSALLVEPPTAGREEEIGVAVEGGRVVNLHYGQPAKWGKIVKFSGDERRHFHQLLADPRQSRRLLCELIRHLVDTGGQFLAHVPSRHPLVEIDSQDDLFRARILACASSVVTNRAGHRSS